MFNIKHCTWLFV